MNVTLDDFSINAPSVEDPRHTLCNLATSFVGSSLEDIIGSLSEDSFITSSANVTSHLIPTHLRDTIGTLRQQGSNIAAVSVCFKDFSRVTALILANDNEEDFI